MKRVLFLSLAATFLSFSAVAKDGPFPIFQSLGAWVTPAKNFEVQISVVKRLDSETALVRVIIRSLIQRELISSGFIIYRLDSPSLDLILRNAQGRRTQVILKPSYVELGNGKKRLELIMELIELDTNSPSSVPTRLIKQ